MVSETVAVGLISVGGTLGGALGGALLSGFFNLLSTRERLKEENTRQHADYFLQQKVESLAELHAQMERCYQYYRSNWGQAHKMSEQDYEDEVLGRFHDFEYAMQRASIFLDEEQFRVMKRLRWKFQKTNTYFLNQALHFDENSSEEDFLNQDVEYNDVELIAEMNVVREMLQGEVNEPIKYFEG
ncbi:hypothetical protein [Halogeometricum luteum]|uniref:Uncharacterized protein n=1 Tax=Halogeometricum luteum TaxID=2950537 RepID=A0ABU2G8F7_9EURY|nr:hypothetical protein [Halogeometricum sp. S3BR5-2]MDS0296533.1 hypothetical protein [Halogeometricum sp. S3BR5-2]